MSETPDPHPSDAPAPADGSASADDRPASRGGRIIAVLLMSALVGAATFILMAVGESF